MRGRGKLHLDNALLLYLIRQATEVWAWVKRSKDMKRVMRSREMVRPVVEM